MLLLLFDASIGFADKSDVSSSCKYSKEFYACMYNIRKCKYSTFKISETGLINSL